MIDRPPLDTADSPAPAAPRPARVQPSTMDLWEQEEAERLGMCRVIHV